MLHRARQVETKKRKKTAKICDKVDNEYYSLMRRGREKEERRKAIK
jgi:hypothetical protein